VAIRIAIVIEHRLADVKLRHLAVELGEKGAYGRLP
jgi:hypothetical protein